MGINIKNKKAAFEYELLEKCIAGIVLTGTEIKSIRQGKVSLNEAYCAILGGELWVRQMNIAEYAYGNIYNHDPKRDRKLLVNKRELQKFRKKTAIKGMSIIPLRLFINEKNLAKLEIALARGKKLYDKRESIKQREMKRQMDRRDAQD
ncbi:MAG: SsrA-binding protein SmpB [Flavobacteriales bacterium]